MGKESSKPFAAVWYEALFGRSKYKVTSTFYQFVLLKRDNKQIVFWLDKIVLHRTRTTGVLFLSLFIIVNSDEICATEIVLTYFEPGLTFMAADSCHHRIDLSMKRKGNKLYDFSDFVEVVEKACGSASNEHTTFFLCADYSSA